MSTPDPDRLRAIKTLPSLIAYLRDELDWPIEQGMVEDDLTFDYKPEELGISTENAIDIKEIKQLRPLDGKQPWGIFWINFEKKRLPVVMLRRILGHLVVKKRASANKASQRAWHLNDLLFISSYGEEADRAITFAHFSDDPESPGDLPVLKVLGWDGADTVLHLADAHETLAAKLRWPKDPGNLPGWREQWRSAFTLGYRQVIHTTDELEQELATLALSIRRRTAALLMKETERGPLRRLYAAFKTALIHDLTEDDFADVMAQTLAYGLLIAKFSRPTGISVDNLVDMVPATNPFLRELLKTFLEMAGRKSRFNFDELGIQDVVEMLNHADTEAVKRDFGNKTRQEDPVIHFYEHFLSAYDKEKKIKRGAFYTPTPVVSYIVRSVHELLQTEFGLEDGLADTTTWGEMAKRNKELKIPDGAKPGDPFVLILDPATGTATFLVEVIEVIFTHLNAKWAKLGKSKTEIAKAWNEYVPKNLLPRLYGYELMMAPYTIAHMKLGLKLSEINARLGQPDYQFKFEGRAHIYLTNSLEPASDLAESKAADLFEALGHESKAVNAVKRDKRFTVVIGNPPYSGVSSNMSEYAQHIVDAYKFVDGAALNEKKLWLQDDYVKFIRKAQTTIDCTKVGVFGYITNHSYLDNPTFRGMRQSLMGTFSSLHALDLHGNTTRAEHPPEGISDKNVFDIQQGVAVCLATRGGPTGGVEHADLWGTRETKYSWLTKHSVVNSRFARLMPDSPYYFFKPQNTDCRAEYDNGWRINEVMPLNCAGFITARDHFVVDLDTEALLERICDFANLKKSDADIRTTYFAGCGSDKYPDGDTRGWKVPEARRRVAGDKKWKDRVRICSYRPFDERPVYWADWMVDWPRPEVSGHMLAGSNVALHVCRQSVSEAWAHVLVARGLIDDCYVSNKSRERGYAHPLFLYDSDGGLAFGNHGAPNFSPAFLRQLASAMNLAQSKPHGLPDGLTPEDIFHYAYAVFHSPGYRNRYAEFLKIDFPRLPLTSSLDLFRTLAKLGNELVALHLVESPKLDKHITKWVGNKATEVEKITYSNETVWIDKDKTTGFRGVPENVWDFHIGGYQICEKWLKDRKGRVLSSDDIAHYHRIVVALSETIRLMAEIDQVIEAHGGWPGAFAEKAAVAGG